MAERQLRIQAESQVEQSRQSMVSVIQSKDEEKTRLESEIELLKGKCKIVNTCISY